MTETVGPKTIAPRVAGEELLLEVHGLSVVFDTPEGSHQVADDVDLKVAAGRTLGLVGESGSGKNVTCLAVLGLLAANGRVTSGEVWFEGRDLLKVSEEEMSELRGCKIAMVFQDPMISLNPVRTIGWQISEALHLHQNLPKEAAGRRTLELLDLVGIPEPKIRSDEYPHQFSGGMSQRAMIAMAIACQPNLLIADDVAVMYAGRVVEETPVLDLFDKPLHHYTRGLLNSLPRIDRKVARLTAIEGAAPPPHEFVEGCRFEPRCNHCADACTGARPDFSEVGSTRRVACLHPVTAA
ncbi:MAG: ABC transporter ATP-binding protein [Paracoccaceae bacterium]